MNVVPTIPTGPKSSSASFQVWLNNTRDVPHATLQQLIVVENQFQILNLITKQNFCFIDLVNESEVERFIELFDNMVVDSLNGPKTLGAELSLSRGPGPRKMREWGESTTGFFSTQGSKEWGRSKDVIPVAPGRVLGTVIRTAEGINSTRAAVQDAIRRAKEGVMVAGLGIQSSEPEVRLYIGGLGSTSEKNEHVWIIQLTEIFRKLSGNRKDRMAFEFVSLPNDITIGYTNVKESLAQKAIDASGKVYVGGKKISIQRAKVKPMNSSKEAVITTSYPSPVALRRKRSLSHLSLPPPLSPSKEESRCLSPSSLKSYTLLTAPISSPPLPDSFQRQMSVSVSLGWLDPQLAEKALGLYEKEEKEDHRGGGKKLKGYKEFLKSQIPVGGTKGEENWAIDRESWGERKEHLGQILEKISTFNKNNEHFMKEVKKMMEKDQKGNHNESEEEEDEDPFSAMEKQVNEKKRKIEW